MANFNKYFLLTIDVEDWFQVENFKPWILSSTWDQRELRVERNVHRILNFFDSIALKRPVSQIYEKPTKSSQLTQTHSISPDSFQPVEFPSGRNEVNFTKPINPKATFFVLGWIAERIPHLVREIKNRGHEVASHGYNHELCHQMLHNDLKADLIKSKKLLEDITGENIYGYRAPSFSINNDILKLIQDCGYLYDSSFNSFGLNSRYGKVDFSGYKKDGILIKISDDFYELPISNLKLSLNLKSSINPTTRQTFMPLNSSQNTSRANLTAATNRSNQERVKFSSGKSKVNLRGSQKSISLDLPLGGGGYFRLIPFSILKLGVKSILRKESSYLFYFHPWEIDPGQPRVREASRPYQFRHYINLDQTHSKLFRLVESFRQCSFITCKKYLYKELKKVPNEP